MGADTDRAPDAPRVARGVQLGAANWVWDAVALAACILALGGGVPWRGVLVAYALTQIAASFPITPGGMGVVEGSLAALLVAYGMPADRAVAATLLYRR